MSKPNRDKNGKYLLGHTESKGFKMEAARRASAAKYKGDVTLICVICGSKFTVKHYRSTRTKCCSMHCAGVFSGKMNGRRSGDVKRGHGNKTIYVKMHGQRMHRTVAENAIGRKLLAGEVVHHKDGNKRNNSPENLEVISSQAEHTKTHVKAMLAARKKKHGY